MLCIATAFKLRGTTQLPLSSIKAFQIFKTSNIRKTHRTIGSRNDHIVFSQPFTKAVLFQKTQYSTLHPTCSMYPHMQYTCLKWDNCLQVFMLPLSYKKEDVV